jgi:hypothetical protein
MAIFRRTNCIITASVIVTLCTVQCNMPDESILLSSGIPYNHLRRVTIPDAVMIKFVLLKMNMLMLETYRGLSALIRHTVQPFTESDVTRCCENTFCPPEDGHVDARNMSRIVM